MCWSTPGVCSGDGCAFLQPWMTFSLRFSLGRVCLLTQRNRLVVQPPTSVAQCMPGRMPNSLHLASTKVFDAAACRVSRQGSRVKSEALAHGAEETNCSVVVVGEVFPSARRLRPVLGAGDGSLGRCWRLRLEQQEVSQHASGSTFACVCPPLDKKKKVSLGRHLETHGHGPTITKWRGAIWAHRPGW